jgi:hypothetical protein
MSMVQDIIQIKIKRTTWADKSLPFLPGNNLNLLGHHLESVWRLPQHSRLNVSLVRPLLSEENQSYQHSPSTSHTWDQTMSWSTPKMGMPKDQSKHQDYASSLLYLQLQLPVLVSEQSVHLQRSICDNVIHYRQAKRSPRGICNLQVAQPEVFLDSRIQHQAYLGVISRSLVIRYNMPLPISFGNNSA